MLERAFDIIDEEAERTGLSMTPLIDMVFLLLIFFVVTTTFTKETGIRVAKARASTSEIIEKKLLLVAVDRHGNYWYDKQKRRINEIADIAVNENRRIPDLNIVIIPDRKCSVEPLIEIMDKLRSRGISRFSLGTQRKLNAGSGLTKD